MDPDLREPGVQPSALIFSHHPAPYRDPVLTAVHARRAFRLAVVQYNADCLTHPEWEWPRPAYPQVELARVRGRYRQALGAVRIIRSERPDVVVVPGLGHPTSLVVLGVVTALGIPFVYSADTVPFCRTAGWSRGVRDALLRGVLRRAGAAWVPGRATQSFLESEGVAPERIFQGCYSLDDASIAGDLADAAPRRLAVRASLGIPKDQFVFLFVGAMIPSRRVLTLVDAFGALRRRRDDVALLLVGGGPEYGKVLETSRHIGGIHAIGPVPVRRLAELYAVSDAYAHAGSEPYSLALVQAAMSGLPIVTTKVVGAALDFVAHGETGVIVDSLDRDAFAGGIATLAEDQPHARAMGAAGQRRARSRGTSWACDQLEAALRTALQRRPAVLNRSLSRTSRG